MSKELEDAMVLEVLHACVRASTRLEEGTTVVGGLQAELEIEHLSAVEELLRTVVHTSISTADVPMLGMDGDKVGLDHDKRVLDAITTAFTFGISIGKRWPDVQRRVRTGRREAPRPGSQAAAASTRRPRGRGRGR